jgi:diacylglycerol kinase family enzyme
MVKALFSSNGATYDVSVDGGRALTRGKAVIIANVRNYAGICEIANQAGITTGCLDIVVLPEESVLAVLKYLMFAKFLRIDLLKSVTYLKGNTVHITSDQPIPVELDGDFNGRHSAVDISMIPASVPLIVP